MAFRSSALERPAHMARLAAGVPFWVVTLGSITAVAVLLSLPATKRHKSTKTLFCEHCGIRLWVTSDEMVGSARQAREERRLEDTHLSLWFKAHINTNCEHAWHFNHSSGYTYLNFAGRRVWKISGMAGSYPTPPIMYFSDDDRARVETLLRESPDSCSRFIHDRLQWKPEIDE